MSSSEFKISFELGQVNPKQVGSVLQAYFDLNIMKFHRFHIIFI